MADAPVRSGGRNCDSAWISARPLSGHAPRSGDSTHHPRPTADTSRPRHRGPFPRESDPDSGRHPPILAVLLAIVIGLGARFSGNWRTPPVFQLTVQPIGSAPAREPPVLLSLTIHRLLIGSTTSKGIDAPRPPWCGSTSATRVASRCEACALVDHRSRQCRGAAIGQLTRALAAGLAQTPSECCSAKMTARWGLLACRLVGSPSSPGASPLMERSSRFSARTAASGQHGRCGHRGGWRRVDACRGQLRFDRQNACGDRGPPLDAPDGCGRSAFTATRAARAGAVWAPSPAQRSSAV